jgi:hypothetical protein
MGMNDWPHDPANLLLKKESLIFLIGDWKGPTASMFPVENRKFSAIPGILSRFAGWPLRFSYNNFTCISNLFVLVIMAVTKHTMYSVINHHSCLVFLRTVSFSVQNLLLNFITSIAKRINYGDIHPFLFLFFFSSSSFSKVF